MTSSSESPVTARFFKVMMPSFHTKLRLPPAFCAKLKGEIPEQAFLTSCKGTWRVNIGQCSTDRICFEKGWDIFVQNHNLKIGEFVIFEQIAHMHFRASIYDSTTCEKEFPAEVPEEEKSLGLNVDEHAKRGRGRPQKRARSLLQTKDEATLGPNVDEDTKEAEIKCSQFCRGRKRTASLQQKEFHEGVYEEKAPFERNLCGHAIQKSGRGRPRKRTASSQQENKYFEKEFPMEINEEKEPFENSFLEHAIQTRGRPSNKAISTRLKQSHFGKRISAYSVDHRSAGLYLPGTICKAYHITEKTLLSLRGPSRKWHEVKLRQHCNNRLFMKTGWLQFCKSNNVKQGDVCVFQITHKDTRASSENIMMDVKVV